ncbi:hypothetical protein G6F61_014760 [Rhizopus arrhizus]|nr:hypothetical protein G6F61_014760 [Rhizopus arrhizus]
MPIRIGARQRAHADDSVAAGPVFNDHRLAPALPQLVGDQSGDDVRRAARSGRRDEPDRLVRKRRRLHRAGSRATCRDGHA